jgi:molybdopterin converting factor small subunit
MDVRVKMNPLLGETTAQSKLARNEVVTGLRSASVKSLLDVLSNRHPELADVFKEAKKEDELRIYVNNDEVPRAETTRYFLRDGDTVSLFVKP